MLLAGRGRSYPALSVAVGERVGLVGALSVESAARALNARDIDGMVIGDGFGPRIVEALLTVLAEDVALSRSAGRRARRPSRRRSSDLPRICPISTASREGPQRLVERFLPFVRLHAFGERLSRMLKSLDAKGMLDPDTGLLGHEAFWRDLNRAVDDAEKRGVGLSIARFSFERQRPPHQPRCGAAGQPADARRSISPAARPTIRSSRCSPKPTCAPPMSSRAGIASMLKNTMLAPDRKRGGIDARGDAGDARSRPTASIRSSPAWSARLPR